VVVVDVKIEVVVSGGPVVVVIGGSEVVEALVELVVVSEGEQAASSEVAVRRTRPRWSVVLSISL